MVAQNVKIAELAAGAGDVTAFPAALADDQPEGGLRNSTGSCVTIAMSRTDPVADAMRAESCSVERETTNLAHASVVCSAIAKGQIIDIDLAAAFRVNGVVSILTHQNLPDIIDDHVFEDETLQPASHIRLLHNTEITFKGQPVALVVARPPEIARHAASLVHVEYESHSHPADAHLQREAAIEVDDPMELGVSTAIFEHPSGIWIRDTARGAQSLRQYLRGRFGCGLRPQFQAMLAARAALALRCSIRVVLTLQQMRDFACAPRQAVIAKQGMIFS
jgi:xanthine dehydrogenase YagR molybdenum-binding subunit